MMSSEGSPDLWWDLLLGQKRENDRATNERMIHGFTRIVSANLSPGLDRGEEAEQPGGSDNKQNVLIDFFFIFFYCCKISIVMANNISQMSKKAK